MRNCDAAHANVPPLYGLPSANSVADCPLRPHSSIRSAHTASVFGFIPDKMQTIHALVKNGVCAPDTQKAVEAQQAASGTARLANQELASLQGLIGAIDAEMMKRSHALGRIAVPGRVHQTLFRPTRRFRGSGMNLRRSDTLATPSRFASWGRTTT